MIKLKICSLIETLCACNVKQGASPYMDNGLDQQSRKQLNSSVIKMSPHRHER